MQRAVNEGSDGIWAQAARATNWLLNLSGPALWRLN